MDLLNNIGDWEANKNLIRERGAETGLGYNELLLDAGLSSGQINTNEIYGLEDDVGRAITIGVFQPRN